MVNSSHPATGEPISRSKKKAGDTASWAQHFMSIDEALGTAFSD